MAIFCCCQAIVQCHVYLIEKKTGTKKKNISGSTGPNKLLKTRKFSFLKLVLAGNLLLLHWVFFDYFYHNQVFVYTCGDKNFFVTNSSQLVSLCCFNAVSHNTLHLEVETHVGENFVLQLISWQDTISMFSKMKYVREFSLYVSLNLNCHITRTSLLPPAACI